MSDPAPVALLVPDLPQADELMPFLRRIDAAHRYTNFGPLSQELERFVAWCAGTTGSPPSVTTVANATLGLELALQARALPASARVLVPTLTFVASATAIHRAGAQPVLCDVDPASWTLTPERARRLCAAQRIDAVMPVAAFGAALDPAAWDAFEHDTGIPVVLDAAGAFGNQRAGERIDVVYSFHATKAFGAGEGGAVAARDPARIAHIRRLSNFGFELPSGQLAAIGTNAKMSEYHCAVALAVAARWCERMQARGALRERWAVALQRECPSLRHQAGAGSGVHSILAVRLPEGADAGRVGASLASEGIETRRWYCPPLHRHPALASSPRAEALPHAELLAEQLLGLPFHAALDAATIDRVAQRLAAAIRQLGVDA